MHKKTLTDNSHANIIDSVATYGDRDLETANISTLFLCLFAFGTPTHALIAGGKCRGFVDTSGLALTSFYEGICVSWNLNPPKRQGVNLRMSKNTSNPVAVPPILPPKHIKETQQQAKDALHHWLAHHAPPAVLQTFNYIDWATCYLQSAHHHHPNIHPQLNQELPTAYPAGIWAIETLNQT